MTTLGVILAVVGVMGWCGGHAALRYWMRQLNRDLIQVHEGALVKMAERDAHEAARCWSCDSQPASLEVGLCDECAAGLLPTTPC